jgi:hypothetical protein
MYCKNCQNKLSEKQHYCDECGAKVIVNRLTMKAIALQINEEFFSLDNKLLKTFLTLFTNPEDVILGYIQGIRKKYIHVIQYFAFSLTLAGLQVFIMSVFFKDLMELNMYEGIETLPGQENNPFKDVNFEFFNNYQGLIYILGVPISAFSTWFVYYILKDRRLNFTEHLVLNLYYSAQVIIITAVLSITFLILGLNYFIVSSIIILPIFWYLYFVLRRVFKDSFWETVAKFLLVCIIYGFLYILLMFILAIVLVLYMHLTKP